MGGRLSRWRDAAFLCLPSAPVVGVGISDPGPVFSVAPGEARLLLPGTVSRTRFAVDTGKERVLEVEVRDASGSVLLQELLEPGESGRVVGELAVSMRDIKRYGSSPPAPVWRGSAVSPLITIQSGGRSVPAA